MNMKRLHLRPADLSIPEMAHILTGAVGPRPIALASTVDPDGNPNLSPFSFFNAFGSNPPILIFSPARKGRDNTTKHTYENLKLVDEVVINVVTYGMVQQISLASSDFPKGVNEFEKAGFTMEPSELVKPFRVAESPVQFECRVLQIIETGDQAAAGNLVICRIVAIHIDESILDSNGNIDPHKIDLVGRLGGDFYCRASGNAVFAVEKPLSKPGIGIDSLPEHVRLSHILTGNDLGRLGNLKTLPSGSAVAEAQLSDAVVAIFKQNDTTDERALALQKFARLKIADGDLPGALTVLMISP